MIVTAHAAQRYVERVAPTITPDEARARIAASARAIEAACDFGARCVRQGDGTRLVLQPADRTVVTVLPRRSSRA